MPACQPGKRLRDRRSQRPPGASISARDGDRQRDPRPASRHAAARAPATRPKIHSPAAPIARGMGLDQPFFDDKNRAFWILQSIGWSGYFFLRTISGFANSMGWMLAGPHPAADRDRLFADLADGLAVPAADQDAGRSGRWSFRSRAVVLASIAFSVIETWSIRDLPQARLRDRSGVEYFGAILLNFSLLAAWTALYYGINYFLLLEDQIRQREKLESQASTAQLAMLRYQLNPHFLFNTLNSISTLVLLKQTERANAMLARLSSFLRYTLANEPTAKVTLAQEVETLKLYLEIEKMRFEDRLRPHFRIESETIGARLPSLLLQPLIENAIKYAVTPSENGADIWITAMPRGPGGADRSRRQRQRRGRRFRRQPVDRRRTGEHSRPSVAGLWRSASFRDEKERARGVQRYRGNSLRDRRQGLMTIRTILVDDEPLATQGLQLRLQAHRRRRGRRHRGQRARGDPPDQDPQARPRLPRHPDAGVRRLLGDPGPDGRRAAVVRVRHRLWRPCAARVRRPGGRLSDEAGRRGPARGDHGPGPPAPRREAQRGRGRAAQGSAGRACARSGRGTGRGRARRRRPRTATRR